MFHDVWCVAVPIDVPIWKHLLITIAPMLLGIIIIAGLISVSFGHGLSKTNLQIALWGTAYGIGMLVTCLSDWRDLIRYFKTGEIT